MSMRPECLDNGVPPVTKELVEATVRAQERMSSVWGLHRIRDNGGPAVGRTCKCGLGKVRKVLEAAEIVEESESRGVDREKTGVCRGNRVGRIEVIDVGWCPWLGTEGRKASQMGGGI